MLELLLIIIAYLIGSIPTAIWVGKYFFGIDVRDYGSGNAGATNTFRVLGARWGSFVMAVDISKGVIACLLYLLIPYYTMHEFARTNFMIGLGMAAVLGHIYPIWAGFKGGKGVATVFGMVLAIQPQVGLMVLIIFLLVLFLTRYVSLSSILASLSLPIMVLVIFKEPELLYRIFAVAIAVLVIFTHQKNIDRLLKGNENKVKMNGLKLRKRN